MFGKLRTQSNPKPTLINKTKIGHLFRKAEQQTSHQHPNLPQKTKKIKKQPKTPMHSSQDLKGAKFRLLNELLYTSESAKAVKYFQQNRQDFQLYHEGYRHQANKWTYRPVDEIITYILRYKQQYLTRNIADLGCGEGFVYEELVKKSFDSRRIKSYDLVSTRPFITSADISKLPLKDSTISLCIFCLSLMGTNYLNFIRQAWRVLKEEGELIITEVESRSPNWKKFMQMISLIGFKLTNNGLTLNPPPKKNKEQKSSPPEARFFRAMLFKKIPTSKEFPSINYQGQRYSLDDFSRIILQSCTYKKR